MHSFSKMFSAVLFMRSELLFAQMEGENMGLEKLYRLSDAKSRSISPENFSG